MNNDFARGLFLDMPNEHYHGLPVIGSTGLKKIKRSPYHFWFDSPLNPEREAKKPSIALRIGSAWHCAVFEPVRFDECYGVWPEGLDPDSRLGAAVLQLLESPKAFYTVVPIPDGLSKRTKEGRQLLSELAAEGKTGMEESIYHSALEIAEPLLGKELLTAEQMRMVRRMAASACALPESKVIFSQPDGMAEASIFVTDPLAGVPVKIRPDYAILPGNRLFHHGLIVDGKSMADASPDAFGRECWNWDMALQAALYSDVWQQHFRTSEPPAFVWLASEKDAPHCCKYYSAPPHLVAYGRVIYRQLLDTYARCLGTGVWPAYAAGVSPAQLPAYAMKTIAETIGED